MSFLSGLFGIGNSQSQSTASTTSNDQRVVGGQDSINQSLRVDGTNNTIEAVDFGAVHDSLQLALAGVESATGLAQQTLTENGDLLSGALSSAAAQQKAFTSTVADIKTSDVRVLIIAALAVVGLGAVVALKKG